MQVQVEEEEEVLLLREVGRAGVNLCSLSTLGHLLGHSLPPHEEAKIETGAESTNKVVGGVLKVF